MALLQINLNKSRQEFPIRISAVTVALLSSAALPFAALAEEAPEPAPQQQRDYLPGNIVVTGELDRYSTDDGSTGTRTPTPIIDVPQAMTVITSDQLEDQGITTLNEALRFVPGVSMESGEGHRDAVFIRGQSTTADFYLDGVRDDAQYYRSLYDIERVEVLKGPNAMIFGRGGGGGVINRVSKVADPMDMFVGLAAQVDTFGAFSLAADINQPLGDGVAGRLNTTYEEFDSNRNFYEGRFFGVAPTVSAWLGDATRLNLSYSYADDERLTDRGLPSLNGGPLTGYYDTLFGDPDYNNFTSQTHLARARLEHEFSDSWSANAALQLGDYSLFYQNIVPSSGTTATTARLSGYESGTDRQNLIAQANLVGTFDTGAVGHTLLFGVEAGDQSSESVRRQVLFDDGMGGTTTSATVTLADIIDVPSFSLVPQRASMSDLSTLSVYAQEQIDFGIVQLVAGIRYDRFDLDTVDLVGGFAGSRVDEGWSPRFGIIVKPQEELSIYASYSESFLPQSGDQFSLIDPLAETLDPEGFTNYEIGLKWAPRADVLFSAAAFRLDRDNSRAPDPLNPGFTILAGETRVEGIELNLAGELVENLQVNLSYTYLDGEVRKTTSSAVAGTRLAQLPEHQIGAWGRYDVTEQLGFGLGVVHQSEQFASLSNNVVLPAYTRVDAAVYFEVNEDFSLQLNVENLLDEEYYPAGHGDNNIQPGLPLNASVGARMRF